MRRMRNRFGLASGMTCVLALLGEGCLDHLASPLVPEPNDAGFSEDARSVSSPDASDATVPDATIGGEDAAPDVAAPADASNSADTGTDA